ncbi:exo-beta-N-acetylmuramidase NamZ family protein [Christiangramia portivictoriae]|uniref:exo-beta-N-acetylmuramidase NamZ family protein n=1 Tax=Christiangramia portivictoriae TaxID=326069 RepID=UPI0004103720|nr:DUF1343 domain-containing protein [Christiangramia portivictoriae]
MIKRLVKSTLLFFVFGILSCGNAHSESSAENSEVTPQAKLSDSVTSEVLPAANRMELILPKIANKTIGIVGNQTSVVKRKNGEYIHLVDTLLSRQVQVKKVFAPEHGFRGTADAGESVKSGKDPKSGLPVISLYGNHKKPTAEDLKDIELLIFDIQDVGARFYTYISTMHYVMEACAEQGIPVLILDRPNPNAHYIDGPILEKRHQSFVGMHPVPVVHGMTIAEYARMINGEKWLKNGIECDLETVPMQNYQHTMSYKLPVKPSPNLPNAKSINLYPSLCFFEGTNVNAGRGTELQFQVFGSPFLDKTYFNYSYTPKSMEGAKYPKHENKECYGRDLSSAVSLDSINLEWLIEAYRNTESKVQFFNDFFRKLAGTSLLKEQIEEGLSAEEIRQSWKAGLDAFRETRKKYLMY